MPTINPRINVTLSPSLAHLVGRLATMERVSKSQVLRELLEAAEPALQRAVALMESASQASSAVRENLARSLSHAQDKAEAQLADMLGHMDQTSADLVQQAEAIRGRRPQASGQRSAPPAGVAPKRRAPARVGSAGNPPASNRGVKSTETGKDRATAVGQSLLPSGFSKRTMQDLAKLEARRARGKK